MLWFSVKLSLFILTVWGNVKENAARLEGFYRFNENRPLEEFRDSTISMRSRSSENQDDDSPELLSLKRPRVIQDFRFGREKRASTMIKCPTNSLSCSKRACDDLVSSRSGKTCYCDRLCQAMDDCCYDYTSACNRSNEKRPTKDEITSIWSCVKLYESHNAVWMKTNCRKSWSNNDIYFRCVHAPSKLNSSTYHEFIPVVGVDNVTYRNQYCAKCNNQNEFDFWHLNLSLKFRPAGSVQSIGDLLNFLVKNYDDALEKNVLPNEEQPRRYCVQPESKCRHGYIGKGKKECLSGRVAIVQSKNDRIIYKNKGCAYCNEQFDVVCGGSVVNDCVGPIILESRDFSMTVNFRDDESKSGFFFSSNCDSRIYDYHLMKCASKDDILPPVDALLDKYRVAVWFKSKQNWNSGSLNITLILSKSLQDVSISNIFKTTIQQISTDVYLLSFDVKLSSRQTLRISKTNPGYKQNGTGTYNVEKFLQPFTQSFPFLLGDTFVDVIKSSFRRLACVGLQTLYPSDYYVGNNEAIYVNKTMKVYSREEYFTNDSSDGVVKVCEKQLPHGCHGVYRKYKQSEFKVTNNLSLFHIRSGKTYQYNDYSHDNNTILICQEVRKDGDMDIVREYLSWIALCLSIFSLIIVLITYTLFSELRTVAGMNLMNLCISLLLFNVFWLVRPEPAQVRSLCVTMAAIIQYLILVSLLSMSTIAHDTLHMFTDPIGYQRGHTSRKYFVRLFLIWLTPLFFVALCLILWRVNILDIEYNDHCWSGGRHQVIVVFVPVCIMTTYNSVCFVISVLEMRKLERNSQMLRSQKEGKKSFIIHVKISTLFGLGWTFSFVYASFSSVSVFSYLFIVFTGFQGFYILLAFVCNKKVLMLYRNLWRGNNRRHSTASCVRVSTSTM